MIMTSPVIGQTLGLVTALLIDLILKNTNYLDVTDAFFEVKRYFAMSLIF